VDDVQDQGREVTKTQRTYTKIYIYLSQKVSRAQNRNFRVKNISSHHWTKLLELLDNML